MKMKTESPLLEFGPDPKDVREDLSAVLSVDDYLWLASDETTSIERLCSTDGLIFTGHKSFSLTDLLSLPANDLVNVNQEIDVEGLALQNDYLWLVGSHSIRRKNLKKEDAIDSAEGIKKLGKTKRKGNRFMLARIPMVPDNETGEPVLRRSGQSPREGLRSLAAAQLDGDAEGNELTYALSEKDGEKGDVHLAKFMGIPSKDNGFDIEGLAICNDRLFVGLRGPVLRGWAVILELVVDSSESKLALRRIGSLGTRYRKHFLQLDGLGIRDMCFHGQDLLILAGPSMALNGPVSIFRWRTAAEPKEEQLVFRQDLEELVSAPFGMGADHAEGMTIVSAPEEPLSVLIVYDSPAPHRKIAPASVRADVFKLN